METRNFPSIGKPISLLGFGLMRLPMSARHLKRIDLAMAESMVDQALAGGINYFDTAYIYHDGQSEPFAAKALSKHPRSKYNIATKMPTWLLKSLDDAKRIFEDQLATLKVELIDFYLVHNLNSESLPIFKELDLYDYLGRKKEEGLIGKLGFSMHDSPAHLREMTDSYEWDFVQIQLNYVDWESLKAGELYSILLEKGIPVVIMEPIRGGQLAEPPPGVQNLINGWKTLASPATWALRYAASLPGVMTVLSGMSHPSQLSENLSTFSNFRPLDDEEEDLMRRLAAEYLLASPVPCTGCGYCMDCPSGVEIPLNFAIYNLYRILAAESELMASIVFSNHYRSLSLAARADQCADCGECAAQCPQRLPIASLMREIASIAERAAAKAS